MVRAMAFTFTTTALPKPYDAARARRTFEALAAEGFVPTRDEHALLEAVFGNSPFLSRLAIREHGLLPQLFARGPDAIVADATARALAAENAGDEGSAMAGLRVAKRQAALAIALADIAGAWDLERVTRALTEFADASV